MSTRSARAVGGPEPAAGAGTRASAGAANGLKLRVRLTAEEAQALKRCTRAAQARVQQEQ